ncbi:MAG: hypothetical protein DMF95_33495 [Acidobacteria bacterium]|nr:MAG: hypothetical protein DMF96_00340 [Acidobacteriota bacterium]PYR23424.1 MAG: hypothetical protein DMF94_01385 [Acidobacteriota bacterium]PYR40439.1 MAG: hypothetical protein DMF95_33495 [Acidobacteriota bacterium]
MFVSKKHIPRRMFLKGAGVTVALPLLEAMVPAATALAETVAGPSPGRFVGMFFPHGMAPGHWVPEQAGALPAKLPYILESLEKVKDRTVVLSGMWSKSAEPPEGTTGSDHWVAAAYLTGIKPRKTAGSDATVGSPTIDQVIAQKIGQGTLLPSLQLSVEDPNSSSSNCGEGYSCSYTNSISWVALPTPAGEEQRTSPLPMELNPQVVFERLFGSGGTPEVRAARMKQNQSILDSLLNELAGLRKSLGPDDRRTVNQYTDEIREIERRIQLAAKASATVPEIDLPPGVPEQFDQHIKLHCDLTALAFRADITRVVTLLGARDLTARSYTYPKSELFPNGGQSVGFHGGSHHQEDPVQVQRYAELNRYHVSTLAYFAEKLRSIPEGDGTLLDHSLIMYGTNMGNSNQHQHFDVPHILVGGANGRLKGGRHVAYERKTVTTGNLLLSVLDMYGIHQDSQGDSTGRLTNL